MLRMFPHARFIFSFSSSLGMRALSLSVRATRVIVFATKLGEVSSLMTKGVVRAIRSMMGRTHRLYIRKSRYD